MHFPFQKTSAILLMQKSYHKNKTYLNGEAQLQ